LLTSTEAVPKAKLLIQCKPSNLLNNVKMVGLATWYVICRFPSASSSSTGLMRVLHPQKKTREEDPRHKTVRLAPYPLISHGKLTKHCHKLIVAVNSNFLHIKSTYSAL